MGSTATKLAGVLLTSAFALYESWCEEVLHALQLDTSTNIKQLQFPTRYDSAGTPTNGVGVVLRLAKQVESLLIVTSLYPELIRHPKHSLLYLEANLFCYRFFKELRNCQMHKGGNADQKCVDAYHAFAAIAQPATLELKEVPQHIAPVVGSPVVLSLRGVVGMTEVITRLIATLDSQLARNKGSESVFLAYWKESHPDKHKQVLPANIAKKQSRIHRLVKKLGFNSSNDTKVLEAFLRTNNLVV